MIRRDHFLAVAALLVMVGGGTIAVAQGNAPRTNPAHGIFTASPQNVKERVCAGQDGPYVEIRGLFSGVITSNDPRLAGDLEFMAEPALINFGTGFGTFRGRFRITDPVTHMQKAEGDFHTVVTQGTHSQGFAFGKVMNTGAGPADDFFANIDATFDAALNVSGEYGDLSPLPRSTPAVVQGGQCSGPFTVQLP